MKRKFFKWSFVSWINFLAANSVYAQLPQPDFANVNYGLYSLNKFDLWLAKPAKPTPVLIYFHGGGFIAGDKMMIDTSLVNKLLARGISVVSANYRLVNDTTFFLIPQQDAVRVIQFIRLNAAKYNIDPGRFGLSGGSAGANMAVWIGLHDEMANPNSPDPVERQSSRVQCVMAYQAQTSNDPNWGFKKIVASQLVYQITAELFGVSLQALKTPSAVLQKKIDKASAITHATADDPPIFLAYADKMTNVPLPPNTSKEDFLHHPMFGVYLKNVLDTLRVEAKVYWGNDGTMNNPMPPLADIDFLDQKLNKISTGIGNSAAKNFGHELRQNYPNPFNAETIVKYYLSQNGRVKLTIYDLRGRPVAVLADALQVAGDYTNRWNGRDKDGKALSSGIYFYELKTPTLAMKRKLTLIK